MLTVYYVKKQDWTHFQGPPFSMKASVLYTAGLLGTAVQILWPTSSVIHPGLNHVEAKSLLNIFSSLPSHIFLPNT